MQILKTSNYPMLRLACPQAIIQLSSIITQIEFYNFSTILGPFGKAWFFLDLTLKLVYSRLSLLRLIPDLCIIILLRSLARFHPNALFSPQILYKYNKTWYRHPYHNNTNKTTPTTLS